MTRPYRAIVGGVAVGILTANIAGAELVRFDISARRDIAGTTYERIEGRGHFVVDPSNPRDRLIVDLDKAPRTAGGRVEFTADLYVLRPKTGGNGVALVDVVNRGRKTIFSLSREGRPIAPTDAEVGDGFLTGRGFTIVCVGWEFDVPARDGLLRLDAPAAAEAHGGLITGIVRTAFTPDRADDTFSISEAAVYPPIDAAGADSILTVRDGRSGHGDVVPRDRWQLTGSILTLRGGFQPGRNYELSYRAANPPIGGLGFAAIRDVTTWLKHDPGAVAPARYAYGFGVSQSGRFLRTFLYEGFNTDERGQQVFDGIVAHIAGASRLDLNRRWAVPTSLAMYDATAFPFADAAMRDPVTGQSDGLLDNVRAREHQPRVFYTNTDVEYWGGGRTAALTHVTADGTTDVELPPNVRSYFFAGAQHTPGAFPPVQSTMTQQKANPIDYWWGLRALIVAMDRWVREGIDPPASQYPRRDRQTLVDVKEVAFPAIPGVQSPRTLTAGIRAANPHLDGGGGAGAPLPLLVPQVDADGNDEAGIRLPEVAAPLATYTGWNFRSAAIGGTTQLVPLIGSYLPLPRTRTEREAAHDPRRSIGERYRSSQEYVAAVTKAARSLVGAGYLLAGDVPEIVTRAAAHWEATMGAVETAAAR
jgi:hypothetical protein